MAKTLYVGPLLASVTERDLTRLFAQYGTVTKAQIPTHPALGGSMGFGFVEMTDGAEEAIAGLNATEFKGTELSVNEAQSAERQPTPTRHAATHGFQIKDITIAEIKAGKNWKVLNPDALLDDVPMECLEIEPLGQYTASDTVVYSGIYVYLKGLGQPRSGLLAGLLGKAKTRQQCRYPPDDPKDLTEGMTPVVEPIVMIKEVGSAGWDYCEYVAGTWRQVGLNPNPDAPLTHEYIASPLDDDREFSICGDNGPVREEHKAGFQRWSRFLEI
jgi:hypothetical protein